MVTPSNPSHEGYCIIQPVIDLAHPSLDQTSSRDDSESTGSPQRGKRGGGALDGPPDPPPPPPSQGGSVIDPLGSSRRRITERAAQAQAEGGDAGPLGGAPDHVAAAGNKEDGVGGPGEDWVAGEAVAYEGEADVGAVALDEEREDAVYGGVGGYGGGEDVA